MMSYRENLQKCHEYIRALEEEKRKIQMFQRELPLCLEIVTQAIESCKQQLSGTSTATATATATTTTTECSEQTTSDGLVFEEFIPIKKKCSSARAAEQDEEEEEDNNDMNELESRKISATDLNDELHASHKSDWLRSAQLWNQFPDPPTSAPKEEDEKLVNKPKIVPVVEVKTTAEPNTMEITAAVEAAPAPPPTAAPAVSACSTADRGGGKKEDGQTRKARRCWSPELHRRFLNALEQLGGPHVATPKQIRELMKVDGLTNDEVKSHLQKYRLHSTRRPTAATHHSTAASTQAPQFVVVGGIWVPPSGEGAKGGAPGVVYTPLARSSQQQPRQQASTSHSDQNGARCNSPATSSSARAATASPAC